MISDIYYIYCNLKAMCGILGRWNTNRIIDRQAFRIARDTMTHRGPDGCGEFFSEECNIALGHRRLSFLDLSESGTQPFSNENNTIWCTVNGEIYNYPELKKNLEEQGHVFRSACDSEIVVHAYEEWGIDFISRLKGMFAFGLFDSMDNTMIIARDRFGIKPLYYFFNDDTFIFSSELKGIVSFGDVNPEIDMSAFTDYFVYRYVPPPKTIWKGIYKLPPASVLIKKQGMVHEIREYWTLNISNKKGPDTDIIKEVDQQLLNSVGKHLMSDVPVGSFLSGGFDSSALVYYCSRNGYTPQTFSIGFENWEKSEHQYAGMVADIFGTEHSDKIVDNGDLDIVDLLMNHYDEPIADISIIPTYIVSKSARQHVKAVLSGEGADEIFAGYTWHRNDRSNQSFSEWLYHTVKRSDKNHYSVKGYSNAMAMGKFDSHQLKELLNPTLHKHINDDPDWFYRSHFKEKLSPVKRFQYMDIKTFMAELVLTKVDRASMANGLEVRVPFLDHELVEYMFALDENSYIKKNVQKFVLHENLKGVLPSEILQRKKQGFVGPDKYYENFEWYRSVIYGGKLIENGLVNEKCIDDWFEKKEHWKLWKLAVMEKWYKKWVGTNYNNL